MDGAKIQLSLAEIQLAGDPSWILTKNSIMARAVTLMAELSGVYRVLWEELRVAVQGPGGAGSDGVTGPVVAAAGERADGSEAMPDEIQGGTGEATSVEGMMPDGLAQIGAEPLRDAAASLPAGMGRGNGLAQLPRLWGSDPKISKGENYLGLPWVILDYPRLFGREDVFAIRTMFWWGHGFQVILHVKGSYREMLEPVILGRLPVLAEAGFRICIAGDEWRHEMEPDNYRAIDADTATLIRDAAFIKLAAPFPLDCWNEAPERLPELFRVLVYALQ